MQAARHLIAQRHIAVLIYAVTLLLKLLVPTWYMIGNDHGHIAITMCSGTVPVTAMVGMHGDAPDHGKSKDHDKADMPCVFSGLSAAVLDAVDPIQLAALIVFVMAVGLAGVLLPTLSDPAYLRPPLRGPPALL